mgnify:CR=1 FL=1
MQDMTNPKRRDEERLRRQRGRSLAIALSLGLLVIIFYAATIVRLGPNAMDRDARTIRGARNMPVEGAGGAGAGAPAATPAPAPAADCKKAGTC